MTSSASWTSRLEATAAASLDNIYAIRLELWPRIRRLAGKPGRAAATTAILAGLVEPWLSDASAHAKVPLKIRKGNIVVYVAHELNVLAAHDMPRALTLWRRWLDAADSPLLGSIRRVTQSDRGGGALLRYRRRFCCLRDRAGVRACASCPIVSPRGFPARSEQHG